MPLAEVGPRDFNSERKEDVSSWVRKKIQNLCKFLRVSIDDFEDEMMFLFAQIEQQYKA